MNTVDVVHITKHQGKMEGILSVSTSTLNNPFCQSHPEQICDYYNIYDLDDEEFLFSGRYSACEDFLSAHPEYKEVSSENE